MKRLVAIGAIWFFCAMASMVLGSTVVYRSGDADNQLTQEVHRLWGAPIEQAPPHASFRITKKVRENVTNYDPQGRPVPSMIEREVEEIVPISLDASAIAARLELEHRRKGLMWFPTYGVDFHADYSFRNDSPAPRAVTVTLPLAVVNAGFDGFVVKDAAGKAVTTSITPGGASWSDSFAPGETLKYSVAYRSRGTSSWRYGLTEGTGQVKGFTLTLDTDFPNIDFPAGTMSPSHQSVSGSSWHGSWEFESLIASAGIGVDLPRRINPGPLASRITFFAPIGLLFFFFVVAVFAAAQRRNLHPLNYFFFGCAFFAFHLLFAYLVDHLAIAPAFATASAVSVFLVVTYARLFVGWGFALREMAIAQVLYLVLFSFTFFWEGFTGLAITVGAILTLFVMMQVTGRVKWDEVGGSPAPRPAST